METAPLWQLFALLGTMIACSAFFSGSETGMMMLDRYRLKHQSRKGHRGARMASKLLQQPDRLIGLILFGNTVINFMAASLATVITIRMVGDTPEAVLAMTILTSIIVLIFAEVTPKTIAALHPEGVAFSCAPVLQGLMWVFYPAVWLVNKIGNSLVRLMGMNPDQVQESRLGKEELRTIVGDDTTALPEQHQGMLLNILDLEKATVNDIMVPKNDIYGLDLDDDDDTLLEKIRNSPYTRLLVYHEDPDNITGIIHLRHASLFIRDNRLDRARMMQFVNDPYFVPESTPLHTQLFNFQKEKRRIGIVVDEYGAVLGAVTLEDILEDIVGEFTADVVGATAEIRPQSDGTYLMEGSVGVRDINRALDWNLPMGEAKTLNGLLLEVLEGFPDGPAGLAIGPYRFEIEKTHGKVIERVRARKVH